MEVKLPNNLIINNKQSITIVGANGSGKTRYSVWIEKNNTDKNVHRISAQKSLRMPESVRPSSMENANEEFLYGSISNDKEWNKTYGKISNRWNSKPETYLLNDFDKLMQLLFTEDYQKSREYRVEHKELQHKEFDNETILDNTIRIFEELLPHRNLKIDAGCIKAGADNITYYNGSEMSDGEREIFYFIASVFAVPQESIIIIDEPENHLHNSILGKLWNILEKSRADCTFIYITHNLDFAVSRINSQLIWVKNYLENDNWDFEIIDENSNIPEPLQLQVWGNRHNVLFIEGDSNSYDFKLYNILFNDYTVIPANGCAKVIQYTTSINENKKLNYILAKGIIDKDRRDSAEIEKYKEKNIYIPKVVEIENIFLLPKVIEKVAIQLKKDDELSTILQQTQENVLDYLRTNKENQALLFVISEINNKLEVLKGINSPNLENYENEIKGTISNINFKDINVKYINLINNILTDNNYEKALCIINNKGLIQESKLNIKLGLKQDNYIELALRIIRDDNELQNYIRQYINIE